MRVYEILTESKELQEGPILNKIGTGIGKAVGTAAKGIGAVAGGVMGLGRAIKKGYQSGKSTVGGAGDDDEELDTAPATTSKAAASGSTTTTANPPAAGAPQATIKKPTAGKAAAPTGKQTGKPAAPTATDDSQTVDTPSGKVKLKDIKTAMSTMKSPQLQKIKSAIDARLQKAA
jgi:hypothetical protein